MEAVVTNGLTKYYGKSRGIVDLSLTVQEGDFFGFIDRTAPENLPLPDLLGLILPSGGSAQFSEWTLQRITNRFSEISAIFRPKRYFIRVCVSPIF